MVGTIDLATRVAATPPDASIRLRYQHLVEDALRDAGHDPRGTFPERRMPGYAMVPVRDYLGRVHDAGTRLGPTPEEGIARLHAGAVGAMLALPEASLFLAPAEREPFTVLTRFARQRDLVASYGTWSIAGERGDATLTLRNEWIWIEAMWLPLLRSVFPACGEPAPHTTCELVDPWSARLRFQW